MDTTSPPLLLPDWPLPLTVAWMRPGGLEEQELHRPLGLPVAQTEVGRWAGSSTLWSEELGVRPLLHGPCSARPPGLQGSGRGWPPFPRPAGGGLRPPEAPRGESLNVASGTARKAGCRWPPCPLHTAHQGPAGRAARAQPFLAGRLGSPSACAGFSLRTTPDRGQGCSWGGPPPSPRPAHDTGGAPLLRWARSSLGAWPAPP